MKKISMKWLHEVLERSVAGFVDTGSAGTVVGLILYDLRNLDLVKEHRIEFDLDDEEPDNG